MQVAIPPTGTSTSKNECLAKRDVLGLPKEQKTKKPIRQGITNELLMTLMRQQMNSWTEVEIMTFVIGDRL